MAWDGKLAFLLGVWALQSLKGAGRVDPPVLLAFALFNFTILWGSFCDFWLRRGEHPTALLENTALLYSQDKAGRETDLGGQNRKGG